MNKRIVDRRGWQCSTLFPQITCQKVLFERHWQLTYKCSVAVVNHVWSKRWKSVLRPDPWWGKLPDPQRTKDSAFCDKGAISGLSPCFFPLSTLVCRRASPLFGTVRVGSLAPGVFLLSVAVMWESREVAVDVILRRKKPPKIFSKCSSFFGYVQLGVFYTVPLLRHFVWINFFSWRVGVCEPRQHTGCVVGLFPF